MPRKLTHLSSKRPTLRHCATAAAVLALSGCVTAGVAFADTTVDATEDTLTSVPECFQPGLFSDQEQTVKESKLSTKASLPSTLDLRHYNGTVTYDKKNGKSVVSDGINYVSPVKLQNPFGSCWAFSIAASAETSLLSSLDKADDGELNGTIDYEKAASGEAGGTAYAASDISERALAYSVFTYPKSSGMYSLQVGEGNYLTSGMYDGASALNNGGMPFTGVSTFSCGIGPIAEEDAPYISDEGWIQVMTPECEDEDSLTFKYKNFTSMDKALEYWNTTWTDEAIAAFNEEYGTSITKDRVKPSRSAKGTWSVDSDKTYVTIAELDQSNILESTKGDGLTDDEIASMKQELVEGRAISIAFTADQSRPGQAIKAGSSYINTDTWAQYTYEKQRVNHGVTIVGYDDNYSASNFTHTQYKEDEYGELVIDEEKTAATTPPGDGAWIVKNSWGASDADSILDQNNWGVDGSGYFYLSYYDMNISCMESYQFDTSDEAMARYDYATAQYDLSKASQVDSQSFDETVQTCNVFTMPEQSESSVSLRDLGLVTGATCDSVTLDMYVIDGDADVTATIEQGKPTATESEYFDKSGFHRIHLDTPIVLKPGQTIAVVQTTKRVNGKYECSCLRGLSEELTDAYTEAHTSPYMASNANIPSYTHTVINEGESLINIDGEWSDWSLHTKEFGKAGTDEIITEVQKEAQTYQLYAMMLEEGSAAQLHYQTIAEKCANFTLEEGYAYDNFSIKLYADVIDEPIDISDASIKVSQSTFTYDGTEKTPAIIYVALPDGTLLDEDDYTVSYSDNVSAGTGVVTVTGQGDFQGTATKSFAIQRAELNSSAVTIESGSFTYTGSAIRPEATVSGLTYGTDYFVMYSNNVNAGTASVIVKGTENYKGSITKTFEIAKASQQTKDESYKVKVLATKAGKLYKKVKFQAELHNVLDGAKVAYSLASITKKAKSYVSVTAAGKVVFKKGLPKGTYTLKVACTVSPTENYEGTTAYITYNIKVK